MLACRVFATCPHCHAKFDLPVYRCPNCKTKHDRLIPGPYGVIFRCCSCGTKLRTSFLTGRKAYDAFCPYCHLPLKDAESVPVCVPVIGTPKSGKTCFLYTSAEYVKNNYAPNQGWLIEATDQRTELGMQVMRRNAAIGNYPDKTTSHNAEAYKFSLDTKRGPKKVLHFYDAAGEVYIGSGDLSKHKFLEYCHGLVVVIDGIQLREMKTKRWSGETSPEQAFINVLNEYQSMRNIASDKVIKVPLAIILNKIDDPAVSKFFGEEFDRPDSIPEDSVRKYVIESGANNFVQLIDQKYSCVKWFAASSLRVEGSSLVPRGVDAVVEWILPKLHPALRSVNGKNKVS